MGEPVFPPLAIIREDERILAVSKPSGQTVIPGRGEIGEPLLAQAEAHFGRKFLIVHRIDREASGLVLFAKDAPTHRRLCLAFERRKVRKKYWAAVSGEMEKGGEINFPLRAFGSGRMGKDARGRPSQTKYFIKEHLRNSAWLEIEPLSGRRHQIRAHLYGIGHPILGDPLYGRPLPVGGFPRLMLHALELAFPESENIAPLRAEPGADFLSLLKGLKKNPAKT